MDKTNKSVSISSELLFVKDEGDDTADELTCAICMDYNLDSLECAVC
jgi:hypothetical protein